MPCLKCRGPTWRSQFDSQSNVIQRQASSLLNSPELRFVCEKVRSGVDGRQVGEVMRFVREGAVSRPDGEDFAQGCAELRVEGKFRGKEFGLAAVDGEGGGAEQVLKGPG